MTPDEVDTWIRAYLVELEAMDSIDLAGDARARRWNEHVNRMQRAQLALRSTAAGRAAITAMIAHPVPTVAQWAAAHALFWDESVARAFLEDLANSSGIAAFDATMVLQEFDAGRLRMDWEPKKR